MKRLKYWGLSILSGLVLAISWPEILGLTALVFFAFVGLLRVEDEFYQKSKKKTSLAVFGYAYLTFFTFNLLTTWWIYYASPWGCAAAIAFNSLFMATVFWLYHLTKVKVGRKEGIIGLVIYWLAFEYLHLNWDLSWTWLTLGNVFAADPQSVQWYQYTGVLGGSLLILIVNLIFFTSSISKSKKKGILYMVLCLVIVFIPRLISRSTYNNYKDNPKAEKVNVVIVQPNIDPYNAKFGGMSDSDQIDLMVKLAREKVDSTTDLLLLPETAFPHADWEHTIEYNYGTEQLRDIIADFPKLRVIAGLMSSKLFVEGDKLPPTARRLGKGVYYDNYNTAMQLDSSNNIYFHHKSKLVLGVEKVPFIKYVPFMKKLSIDLGGSAGGYGSQEIPTVFFDENGKNGIAPIICYESIYGEYVTEYANEGAGLYAIITNDGWWDDTPGYKQHLDYARLRAIEGRKYVVRSANTGISAIINPRGDIVAKTKWWVPAVIEGQVKINNESTFYNKHGDYIGRIAAFVAVLLLLYVLVKSLNKTEQRLNP